MVRLRPILNKYGIVIAFACAILFPISSAKAATCQTQSQMTASERTAIANFARQVAGDVQSGNVQAMRADTIPAVAANFNGIAASAGNLTPSLQHATVTVDNLYLLDASGEPAGSPRTDFYCGSPVVSLNFTNLPPGKYALAILHATGVPKPQQISLVLSETSPGHWMLAGFFPRPMVEAGHNGLWYWEQARDYAKKNMNWDAWFYYQTAAPLLQPVPFLSSPNLQKLGREADRSRPANLPGTVPMALDAHGTSYDVASLDTTSEFGGLDLELHYIPNPAQLSQLHDPVAARSQTVDVMTALLVLHPELRTAFHGIWVHADQGNSSVYALELPMNQIGTTPATGNPPAQ